MKRSGESAERVFAPKRGQIEKQIGARGGKTASEDGGACPGEVEAGSPSGHATNERNGMSETQPPRMKNPSRPARRKGGRGRSADDSSEARVTPAAPADAPPESPLDFAQSVFRDPAQPMALRAGMAKAALPYMHGRQAPANADADREQAPKLPPPFDLPDPYGALCVEWRDALEQAGLISPMHLLPSREAGRSESEAGSVRASSASPARRSSSGRAQRAGVGADAAPQVGEGEEKKSKAKVKVRKRRSRDVTREQTQKETHEQRIERDPYDPHPGYRWI